MNRGRTSAIEPVERPSALGWAVAVAVVALAAHARGLAGEFVNWDDPANILENEHIRGFGRQQLHWMWTSRHLGVYEPLSWMLKALAFSIGGLDPRAFHGVTWVLHAANGVVFFFVARRLLLAASSAGTAAATGTTHSPASVNWGAAAAAALFAVHPLRVECVAWATGQPYVLAGGFALLALWAYLRSADAGARRSRWLGLSLLFYVCSLLSKSIAVPLPAVLLLLDVYPLRRLGGRAAWFSRTTAAIWAEKFAFAVPAVVAAVVAATTPVISVVSPEDVTLSQRLAIAAYGVAFYPLKTLLPTGLMAFYPMPYSVAWTSAFLFAAVVALGATAVAVACWRWRPVPGVWACYLLFIAPVLGLVRHGDQLAADRYSYLSCLGFALLAGAAVVQTGRAGRFAAVAAAVLLSVLTWQQTGTWHDSLRLWTHAIDLQSDNWVARNNRANVWLLRGDYAAARRDAFDALKARPDYPDAHLTAGIIFEREGNAEEAIEHYRKAVQRVPFHEAAINLGVALHKSGRTQEARDVYVAALRADPTNRRVAINLALILAELGRHAEAERLLNGLLKDGPPDARLLRSLGLVLVEQGRIDEASAAFAEALRLDPADAQARYHLAHLHTLRNDWAAGIAEFQRVVELKPDHIDARAELAVALLHVGRTPDAVDVLEAAHRAAPDDLRIVNKLAWVLATTADDAMRDPDRALTLAAVLCEKLQYANADALDTLAAALAGVGRFEEAAARAEQAVALAQRRQDSRRAAEIERRAASYRDRRPWREPAPP